MEKGRIPKPGEIYRHYKNKLYQIITIATHTETGELMVVYQALYGEYKSFVRPLHMFLSDLDPKEYHTFSQKQRFQLLTDQEVRAHSDSVSINTNLVEEVIDVTKPAEQNIVQTVTLDEEVNSILLEFLDADTYQEKLNIIKANMKHMDSRLINNMAVSLDCTIEEGPIEERVHNLIVCLQAMTRFENRRLR